MADPTPSADTLEQARRYLSGYASAKRELLFDRNGSPGHYDDPAQWTPPSYYWCPSIMIAGKQHGVIGPNKRLGHHTRKEAVRQAQLFLDRCREILGSGSQ